MRFASAGFFSLFATLTGVAVIALLNKKIARETTGQGFVQERLAAEAVTAGHSVIFSHDMTEPVFRWDLAEDVKTAPNLVFLGSSHGQQVSADFFPGHSFLNLCVAGGTFIDDLISSEIFEEKKLRPQIWLVIVDPWLFDAQVDYLSWQARPDEFARIDETLASLSAPKVAPYFLPRINAFRSKPNHFLYQLDPLLLRFDQEVRQLTDRPVIADGENYQAPVIRNDGSMQRRTDSEPAPREVQELALRQFSENNDRHRYGNYRQVDPELLHVFETWIRFLQRDGRQVVLIFTPYHPAIFGPLIAQPLNRLREIERTLRAQGPELKVTFCGSYDPDLAGVNADDFSDGDHLRPEGLRKLLGGLAADFARSPRTGLSL